MTYGYKRTQLRVALWVIACGVLSIITLVVAIGVSSCVQSARNSAPPDYARADNWTPPQQTFLQSSMHAKPVPGWRIAVQDLDLPPADSPTGRPQIGNASDPYPSDPFIGNLGDIAYFLASAAAGETHWWLVAVNVQTGARAFSPISLGTGLRPACFLNGPDALLCLEKGHDPQAWVIDSHTGRIIYSGETDLTLSPGHMGVEQAGIYAVAGDMNNGLYGIGNRADTTWFVPGIGSVHYHGTTGMRDVEPPTLAAQTVNGRGALRMRVFSLVDGTVIKPELEQGFSAERAVVYPGGFAVEFSKQPVAERLSFYDESGNHLRTVDRRGFLDVDFNTLPIAGGGSESVVFSSDGYLLARIASSTTGGNDTLMIGPRLFTRQSGLVSRWAQYDLRSGEERQQCDKLTSFYVGSDGEVGIFSEGDSRNGVETRAVDLATCTISWSITSPPGSFRDVWRINTTLVQLSDDGTELMSLVAPIQ